MQVLLLYPSEYKTSKVDDLKGEVESLPGTVQAHSARCDLSKTDVANPVLSPLDEWLRAGAKIDISVDSSGTEVVKHLQNIQITDYEKVYNINVHVPILLSQALFP